MKASNGSIIDLDIGVRLPQKKINQTLNHIERSLSEITSSIRMNTSEKSIPNPLQITDKFVAIVEYGRLLEQLSKFLYNSTLISLHERLTSDLQNLKGGSSVIGDIPSEDSLYLKNNIESLSLRLNDIENWVG